MNSCTTSVYPVCGVFVSTMNPFRLLTRAGSRRHQSPGMLSSGNTASASHPSPASSASWL